MPTTDIHIVPLGASPPWEASLADGSVVHLPDAIWHIALLEAGMQSGAHSVALWLDLPADSIDGYPRAVVAETSLAALIATLAAARGAYPEAFVGSPFDERPASGEAT